MSTPPEQRPPYRPQSTPAEPPTRPLAPVADEYAQRPYATGPYAPDRATFWTIESLRNAVAFIGLVAVLALGLAVWALLRTDRPPHRAPASAAVITALTTRVNHLAATVNSLNSSQGTGAATTQSLTAQIHALRLAERRLSAQVAGAATAHQLSQLSSRVSSLSSGNATASQVSQLSGRVSSLSGQLSHLAGRTSSLSSQFAQLSGRVASLSGQVSQLKSQTSTSGTSTAP